MMLDVEFSSQAYRFLKKAEKQLQARLVEKIEQLRIEPFLSDVKRIVNRREKVFRVRIGDFRILYCVFYERNLLFVSDIDKRTRVYD